MPRPVRGFRGCLRLRSVVAVFADEKPGEPPHDGGKRLARRHGDGEPPLTMFVRDELRVERRSKLAQNRYVPHNTVRSCDLAEEVECGAEEGATGLRQAIVRCRARG